MSEPFLITGLPRSRTAWLAAAALNDQSICWHEPIGWLSRWQDVFDIWAGDNPRYIGVSDSALGFHLREIIERAAPRVLVVERDIADVETSLAKLGRPGNYCALLQPCLDFAHPSIRRVTFKALAEPAVVMRCLRHLMPEAAISQDRLRVLQRLNIQVDTKQWQETARERSGDIASLLGPEIASQLR